MKHFCGQQNPFDKTIMYKIIDKKFNKMQYQKLIKHRTVVLIAKFILDTILIFRDWVSLYFTVSELLCGGDNVRLPIFKLIQFTTSTFLIVFYRNLTYLLSFDKSFLCFITRIFWSPSFCLNSIFPPCHQT